MLNEFTFFKFLILSNKGHHPSGLAMLKRFQLSMFFTYRRDEFFTEYLEEPLD